MYFNDLSCPIGYGLDKVKGSRRTVDVQRLLQPTRELVSSRYETGLRVKVLLLPGDYNYDIDVYLYCSSDDVIVE